MCGTTHKTVRRVVEAARAGDLGAQRKPRTVTKNTDAVTGVIDVKVRATDGRITAKRLLDVARAEGYTGSPRNLRRAVAGSKKRWRTQRRVFRPWVPIPGEHVVIDWASEGGWEIFCAVAPWSRWRFVRVARDQKAATTMRLLAECFAELGGVPKVVLADRMGCLKGGVVANVVVPTGDYVRFATAYGFRPDFCEAADPESKGVVEALCGYVQTDLVIPADGAWASEAEANDACRAWCFEVNGRVHSTIAAVPETRLVEERKVLGRLPALAPALAVGERRKVDKLATIRFGSARYSVPRELVGRHVQVLADGGEVTVRLDDEIVARHGLVGPGEVAVIDEHYGGPRRGPARAVRARTGAERCFLALGPPAEQFLRQAAAAGTTKLGTELGLIVGLEAAWGREALVAAVARAVEFRRFKAADVRSILQAGPGVPTIAAEGEPLEADLPAVTTRPLSAYALEALG